ncbi:photosynthetic complex assembly protein PuhC [uncultured Tateyamaria sp.]|uniref:photosynthetic complex assembly protein PuhC n=1 Tax=uncultured Tateyamaria sp. TaxID=455651 RepID=UPI00260B7F93|nr:photosynthetic complex assembly protein PuhC [uncultured Tateyamaria sp.]
MSDTSSPARIHAKEDELVPRILVRAVMALILAILALVTIASVTDRPLESAPADGKILTERTIFISGEASGAARVLGGNGALLADFDTESGGFVAGIDRVIIRERNKLGADLTAPVILRLREGNRLSLYDPETNWSAELMGFGATNLRTFARLLSTP